MKHEIKTYRAEVKAEQQGDKGVIDALVSVFGNVDMGGDRVMPGAFKSTLEEWAAKGDPIPFIFSHQWENPDAYLGIVTSAVETDAGLEVKAQIDMSHPPAARVFNLMKSRAITQFSFGYYAKDFEYVEDPDLGKVRELRTVDLFEVGPTLLGMNPDTQLLEAASAFSDTKAGRVLSSKNEQSLKDARDMIDAVLSSAEPIDPRPASVTGAKSADAEPEAEESSEAAVPEVILDIVSSESTSSDDGALDEKAVSDDSLSIDAEQVIRLLAKTRHAGEE